MSAQLFIDKFTIFHVQRDVCIILILFLSILVLTFTVCDHFFVSSKAVFNRWLKDLNVSRACCLSLKKQIVSLFFSYWKLYFYFSSVQVKARSVLLILHSLSVVNKSDFCWPVHLLFHIALIKVERSFINEANFTWISSKCLSDCFVPSNCVQMFLRVSVNYCTSKTTLIP